MSCTSGAVFLHPPVWILTSWPVLEAACEDRRNLRRVPGTLPPTSGTVINYRGAAEFDAFFREQYEANSVMIEAAGLN
jgi:hypothetical protein